MTPPGAMGRARPVAVILVAGLISAGFGVGCGSAGNGPSTVRADGYVATFDAQASRTVQDTRVDGRSVAVTTYVAAKGRETDAIAASLLPTALTGTVLTQRLDSAVSGSATGTEGTVVSRRLLRWLGHPAEDAVIATTDRLIHERVMIVGRWLYVVEGISASATPTFAGYEQLLSDLRLTSP